MIRRPPRSTPFPTRRSSDLPGEFDLPHGLALDHTGRIYVADRSNRRVQIFDGSGHYVGEWNGKDIGRPYGIAFASNGTAFVADGGDQPDTPPDRSKSISAMPIGALSNAPSKRSCASRSLRSAIRRSVMSRMAQLTRTPSSVSSRLKLISMGNSVPFLRRPYSSWPCPIGRTHGS